MEAMKENAVHKLDAIFRYKAVDYFTYEEEDQEEEEEEEGEEEVNGLLDCVVYNVSSWPLIYILCSNCLINII